ncbi:hypothetical protein UFOVP585_8 [uncultured Caudovirales phage]|uniref:Uncharacterized protein n=1 Tax=uncultured Caudovirales phage TaxID=2100421 RepID=A0A6J5N205_9CAUD|nr:hypothetical protein UFOVP585_8 [uncultured Caudovirales phage]
MIVKSNNKLVIILAVILVSFSSVLTAWLVEKTITDACRAHGNSQGFTRADLQCVVEEK